MLTARKYLITKLLKLKPVSTGSLLWSLQYFWGIECRRKQNRFSNDLITILVRLHVGIKLYNASINGSIGNLDRVKSIMNAPIAKAGFSYSV